MKSNYILILSGLILSLALTSSACKNDGKTVKDQNNEAATDKDETAKDETAAVDPVFFKCWTHAFEQDSIIGIKLFLSCMNHTMPVARYRQTFTLHEDGKAEYTVLGENDAHRTENGKWIYYAATQILQIRNGNDVVHEYEVLEVNDDVLRVKE